jgi:hypothetical protein
MKEKALLTIIAFAVVAAFLFVSIDVGAKEKKPVPQEEEGSASSSSGEDADLGPEDPNLFGIESTACTWWWVSGKRTFYFCEAKREDNLSSYCS